MRRLIGALLLTIGILGIVLSIAGIIVAGRVADQAAAGLQEGLSLTSRTLDTVEASLVQTKAALGNLNQGLDTVVKTITDSGQTIDTTRSMLHHVSKMAGEDLPKAIEGIQAVTSNAAQAATGIDNALAQLKNLDILILGVNIHELAPLGEPLSEMATGLSELSRNMRSDASDLKTITKNTETMRQNVSVFAKDLAALNAELAAFEPILDEQIEIVRDLRDTVGRTQASIERHKRTAKLGIMILMIWIGLSQVTPLYLGWELVTTRRAHASDHPLPSSRSET